MATLNKVKGVRRVVRNLKRRKVQLAAQTEMGLRTAGVFLQRESMKLVPIDTGNLRASAFTRVEGKGFKTEVNVGYTAAYALFVHENVQMKLKGQPRPKTEKGTGQGSFWDPQGRAQAKFLEEPMRSKQDQIRQIIKGAVQIGKF